MKLNSSKKSLLLILITVFLANSKIAYAEDAESVANDYRDRLSNGELVSKNSQRSDNKEVITEQNFALSEEVKLSLWWAKEQFDPFGGRLINHWEENPQLKQIDLVVNWQLWTLLDYLGRYRLVNQLGTVTGKYKYDLRIINQQEQFLAAYECVGNDFPKCKINLNSIGQDSFQVEPEINN